MLTGKRYKLNKINCDYTIYSIFGMNSFVEEHRFAHFLNKTLDIDFFRINDFIAHEDIIKHKKKNDQISSGLFDIQEQTDNNLSFPIYYYEDELYKLSYLLLKNYNSANYLFVDKKNKKNKKNADYILLIFNNTDFSIENLFNKIYSIPGVSACFKIDCHNDYEAIIHDIEYHLIYLSKKEKEQRANEEKE